MRRRPSLRKALSPCTASVGQPDLACAAPPSTFATADLSIELHEHFCAVFGQSLGCLGLELVCCAQLARPRLQRRGQLPERLRTWRSRYQQGVRYRCVHRRLRLGNLQRETGAFQSGRFAGGVAATDLRPEVRAGIFRRPNPDVRQRRCREIGAGEKASASFCPTHQIPHHGQHHQHRRRNRRGCLARAGKHGRPLRWFHQHDPSDPATSANKSSTSRRFPARPPSLIPPPAPMAEIRSDRGFSKARPRRIISSITRSRSTTTITPTLPSRSPSTVRHDQPQHLCQRGASGVEQPHRASRPHQRRVGRTDEQKPCGAGL